MSRQVPSLPNYVQQNAEVYDDWIGMPGSGRIWLVDPICNISTREKPVMRRVLDDISCRHRGGREAMEE